MKTAFKCCFKFNLRRYTKEVWDISPQTVPK